MSTGKWCEPNVPHKGWTCEGVEELEDGFAVCEMCEVQIIRYIHTMSHPQYPESLEVGCVCAGNMEQNLVGARRRESACKNYRRRKDRWLNKAWRTSKKGNSYANINGWNIVVFQTGSLWGARVLKRGTDEATFMPMKYPDINAAKIKALELVEQMGGKI